VEHLDVLVVGAGLSGVGAAHHLKTQCPWASFALFEARDAIGGTSKTAMLAGGGLGLGAGSLVSALLYFGLLAIPTHRLFSVTSWLITLLAAGMASQAILFLQQGGYFEVLTSTVWDTSRLLSEGSIAGRLLHTLIGYSDAPNGAQLIVYVATILAISVLMRMVPGKRTLPDAIPTKVATQL